MLLLEVGTTELNPSSIIQYFPHLEQFNVARRVDRVAQIGILPLGQVVLLRTGTSLRVIGFLIGHKDEEEK